LRFRRPTESKIPQWWNTDSASSSAAPAAGDMRDAVEFYFVAQVLLRACPIADRARGSALTAARSARAISRAGDVRDAISTPRKARAKGQIYRNFCRRAARREPRKLHGFFTAGRWATVRGQPGPLQGLLCQVAPFCFPSPSHAPQNRLVKIDDKEYPLRSWRAPRAKSPSTQRALRTGRSHRYDTGLCAERPPFRLTDHGAGRP